LTDRGATELRAYGVRTVVDLRHEDELQADPAHALLEQGFEYRSVPLYDPADREAVYAVFEVGKREAAYAYFLRSCAAGCAAAIAAFANAPKGGVIIACRIGRDRTGVVCALLLSLAHVTDDAIAADYTLSEPALETFFDDLEAATSDPARREVIGRLRVAPPGPILAMLRLLEDEYGARRDPRPRRAADSRSLRRGELPSAAGQASRTGPGARRSARHSRSAMWPDGTLPPENPSHPAMKGAELAR
jgi:hypothetical protein